MPISSLPITTNSCLLNLTATVSVIYRSPVLSFGQNITGGNQMEPILNIENLTKTYDSVPNQTKALDGITFQVMPRRISGDHGKQRFWKVHAA